MPGKKPERHETERQGWAAFEALWRVVLRLSRRGGRYARAQAQGPRRGRAAMDAPEQGPPGWASADRAGERVLPQLLPLLRAARRSPGRRRLALLAAGIVAVVVANAAAQIRLNLWQGAFYDALEHRACRPSPASSWSSRRSPACCWRSSSPRPGCRRRQGQAARVADPRPARPVAGAAPRLPARLRRPGRHQPRPAPARGRAPPGRALGRPRRRPAPGLAAARQLRRRALGALGARRRSGPAADAFIVPGYMVWCALAYAACGSWLTWRIGRPLVRAQRASVTAARPSSASRWSVSTRRPRASRSTAASADERLRPRRHRRRAWSRVTRRLAGGHGAADLDHLRLRLARARRAGAGRGPRLLRRRPAASAG